MSKSSLFYYYLYLNLFLIKNFSYVFNTKENCHHWRILQKKGEQWVWPIVFYLSTAVWRVGGGWWMVHVGLKIGGWGPGGRGFAGRGSQKDRGEKTLLCGLCP